MERIFDDTRSLATIVRQRRHDLRLTQPELSLSANVGVRFVVDLEAGKETSQIGLVLRVLKALGIRLHATHSAPSPHNVVEPMEIDLDDDDAGPTP